MQIWSASYTFENSNVYSLNFYNIAIPICFNPCQCLGSCCSQPLFGTEWKSMVKLKPRMTKHDSTTTLYTSFVGGQPPLARPYASWPEGNNFFFHYCYRSMQTSPECWIHNWTKKKEPRPKCDLTARSERKRASSKQNFLMSIAKICQL